MPADGAIWREAGLLGHLPGMLLVCSRIGGIFVFLPFPGIRSAPATARVLLALGITLALWPFWPAVRIESAGHLALLLAAETVLGLSIGLAVTFIEEVFLFGAQTLSLQAGHSFATTIDPASQADSGVLQVFMSLLSGFLFFAFGLHLEVFRAVGRSLINLPPGAGLPALAPEPVARLGGEMISTGLRLALPVAALLLLVDLALALLGRINTQLQLLTVAFPAKMLAVLGLLATLAGVMPVIYHRAATQSFEVVWNLVGR